MPRSRAGPSIGRPSSRMRPLVGAVKTAEQIEQRRFSAAARADKGQELAGPHVERDVLQRGEAVRRPASLAANDKLLADLLEADLDRTSSRFRRLARTIDN